MNNMTYKKFIGSVNFSSTDQVFYGKIENISDLVSFEGNNTDELRNAFHEAADDYIELCRRIPKDIPMTEESISDNRSTLELHC